MAIGTAANFSVPSEAKGRDGNVIVRVLRHGNGGGEDAGGDPVISATGTFTSPAWSFVSPDNGNAAAFAVAPTGHWLDGNIDDSLADYSAVETLSVNNVSAIIGNLNFTTDSETAFTSATFPDLKVVTGDVQVYNFSHDMLSSLDLSALQEVHGSIFDIESIQVTSLNLSSLTSVDGDLYLSTLPACATIDLSSLASVSGKIGLSSLDGADTISLPSLTHVGGDLNISNCDTIANLNLPVLETVDGTLDIGVGLVTSLDLSSLISVGSDVSPEDCASLTTIDFSSLVSIGGTIDPHFLPLVTLNLPALATLTEGMRPSDVQTLEEILMPVIETLGDITIDTDVDALTTVTLGSTLKVVTGNVVISSGALTESSVDSILVRLAALDGTNGTTSYDNKTVTLTGTSSPPSATGLTAKATLEGRGNTVTVNS